MESSPPADFLLKKRTEAPAVLKFFGAETRISASYAKIGARYYYIRKASGGGDHPLLGCREGSALRVVCRLFVIDGSTARKMHPVTVDASAPQRITATAQANGA
jgi:hypothetical protein